MRRAVVPAVFLLAAGLVAGGWLLGRAARATPESSQPPTRLFQQVMNHVRRFGVDSLSEQALYRLAAQGLVHQLDDEYAGLLPAGARGPTEHGDPGGLGLQLSTRRGRVMILGVLPGSPAERAGIRPGDQLLEVGGAPVDAGQREEVLTVLHGPAGSTVELRTRRPGPGTMATWVLTRGQPRAMVVSPGVLLEGTTGYVALPLIGRGAARELESRLRDLTRSGAARIVLDLRGTSQGDLEEAVRVAELFLDRGAPIVEVRGRGPEPRRFADERPQAFGRLPLAVLVDGGTADAGEVVAAALQDNDRGLVVGQPTFGRGLSPEVFPLGDRMSVRISTGRWYTPSGRPIQRDTIWADNTARPRATTLAGRTVFAGGGVVPDSLVAADTLTDASRDFLRALAARVVEYHRVLETIGRDLAATGRVAVGFEPTARDRARLHEVLAEEGAWVPVEEFTAAARRINRELGDAAVHAALGEAGLIRHRALRDSSLRLAVRLLERAATPEALVLGG